MIKVTDKIDILLNSEDDANVFYSDNYASFERATNNTYIFLYSENYVLACRISNKACFIYVHFPSEPIKYNQCGNESLKEFLNDIVQYLRQELNVQWINMNDAASLFMDYPDGAVKIPFGSHVIDLSLDEEALWKNVHSKHRNVIKKAEKDGVIIKKGTTKQLIADYHKIDVETWSRSNRGAKGEDSLSEVINSLGDNVIIYMAYKDDEPQSGAIFFVNKQMCYYIYGANKNNQSTGSGNLLQWKAILDMKEAGVKKYSFVGCRINEDENSKFHGIQRFKERFGGELIQGYLFKIVFNKPMWVLFNLLVSIKSFKQNKGFKFPQDVIDQEINKWE